MIPTYKVLKQPLQFVWRKPENRVLILSALSPLALHLIGVDHIRWSALAISNALIAIVLIAYRDPEFTEVLSNSYLTQKKMMAAVLFINLIVGPLAVMAIGW